MNTNKTNTTAQLLCLWSGPLMMVLFCFGFAYCAEYLPPPPADLTPEQLVARIQNNLSGHRMGMMITMAAWGLMVPWACAVAARLRSAEGDFPVLMYTQIGCAAIGSLTGQASTVIFEAIAYRLDDTDPQIIRALHDVGFFIYLAPWPSFTIWCFALAIAIFKDDRPVPDYPRWAAYLSLWTGVLLVPICFIFWFKVGPFSWNGIIAFYMPVIVFFLWVVGLTAPAIKAVNRDAAKPRDAARPVASVSV